MAHPKWTALGSRKSGKVHGTHTMRVERHVAYHSCDVTGGHSPSGQARNARQLWHFPAVRCRLFSLCGAVLMSASLGGCADFPEIRVQMGAGDRATAQRFVSMIAADEPEAGRIAEAVLADGGNAADAATALGLALAVTLPSSASLDAQGACLVHDGAARTTEALDFSSGTSARGLRALHAKYGRQPWPQVVAPSEKLARFGYRVSRAFAQDLAGSGAILTGDARALTMFMTPQRHMAQAGDTLTQAALATVLAQLREHVAEGGGVEDAPRWSVPDMKEEKGGRVYALRHTGDSEGATSGMTGFVVGDTQGSAVACVLSMGKPFGAGHVNTAGILQAMRGSQALEASLGVAGDQRLRFAATGDLPRSARLVNVIRCADATDTCQAESDPRGSGYAYTAPVRGN